jgi:hypothetical protein
MHTKKGLAYLNHRRIDVMANNADNQGKSSFIIGGLVAVLAILGYLYYTGNLPGISPSGDITATTPAKTSEPAKR